jgi:tryptophanase
MALAARGDMLVKPDLAREALLRTNAEPYRIKVVEHLRLPERSERERILRDAFFSPVFLQSADIFVDLITDSGTGAMSDEQWAGIMRGDEAYMGSKSYAVFDRAVKEVTGFCEVVPTHQGRAAENIVMDLLVKPGDIVLSNTHFDTTRAHVLHRGATPVDLVGEWLWDFSTPQPFKGNFDLEKLRVALERYHTRVPLIVITVLNNFACSSPVSMENIREVRRLADKYGIAVFIDACRFAENAHFIREREPGYSDHTIERIVHELLSYGTGCWMSAKKDAIVNIGGFIATNDLAFADRCREKLVLYEGFYTYGGLAGRDLEAIAVGLHEGIDGGYLAHRTRLVEYLGDGLEKAGAVVSRPIGGSGVFVDVQAMYPHLSAEKLPGVALCADFYLEGGVRVAAAPFEMNTIDLASGDIVERGFQFARFAVPRRVYTKSHMDYVTEIANHVVSNASSNPGYRVAHHPELLGHFFAKFAPLSQ